MAWIIFLFSQGGSLECFTRLWRIGACLLTTSINSLYHTARETDRQTQRERLITFLSFHSVCPAGKDYVADRLSSTCYRLDLSLKNWTTARDDCAANGEMLVVLEPVVKAQFIKNFLTANRRKFWDGEEKKKKKKKKKPFCTILSIVCTHWLVELLERSAVFLPVSVFVCGVLCQLCDDVEKVSTMLWSYCHNVNETCTVL